MQFFINKESRKLESRHFTYLPYFAKIMSPSHVLQHFSFHKSFPFCFIAELLSSRGKHSQSLWKGNYCFTNPDTAFSFKNYFVSVQILHLFILFTSNHSSWIKSFLVLFYSSICFCFTYQSLANKCLVFHIAYSGPFVP